MSLHDKEMEEISLSYVCRIFPSRKNDSHKGDFGRLLCITGSKRMPGAAVMSSYAALRCGAGLLTTATAEQNIPAISSHCWESMYLPLCTDDEGFITWQGNEEILSQAIEKSDAVLIGCGLGVTEETAFLVENVVKLTKGVLVVDADGLNVIANSIDIIAERKQPLILTPHPGEMARLMRTTVRDVQQNRISTINNAYRAFPNAVVVLKGSGTLIGYGNSLWINPTGNPGMSRGGSGDVLAGMIASFAAQGISPENAAIAGVYLHGMAGDIAAKRFSQAAMLPRDIIDCIPETFLKIEENR